MSGETEQEVSGWTVDTVHSHLQREIVNLRAMLDERYQTQTKAVEAALEAQQTAMQTAFTASQQAVDKALAAAEKAVEQRATTLDREFHEHLEQVRHENALAFLNSDKAVQAAFIASDKAIQAALASAEKAVAKAEAASEKRFEAVNEFRAQLRDQQIGFLSRDEYHAAHVALVDKVEAGNSRLAERVAALELRVNSMHSLDQGAADARNTARLNIGAIVGLAGFILTVMIVATTVILSLNK